jgi:hypothetical protein
LGHEIGRLRHRCPLGAAIKLIEWHNSNTPMIVGSNPYSDIRDAVSLPNRPLPSNNPHMPTIKAPRARVSLIIFYLFG